MEAAEVDAVSVRPGLVFFLLIPSGADEIGSRGRYLWNKNKRARVDGDFWSPLQS